MPSEPLQNTQEGIARAKLLVNHRTWVLWLLTRMDRLDPSDSNSLQIVKDEVTSHLQKLREND